MLAEKEVKSPGHTKLENEEPLQLVRRSEKNRELNRPENQMANHLLGGDTNTVWDVVGNIEVAGPDRSDHLRDGSRPSVGLNGVPEESCGHPGDDCESRKVPSERGSNCHWERNMETSSHDTVQDQRYGTAKRTEDDADDGLAAVVLLDSDTQVDK